MSNDAPITAVISGDPMGDLIVTSSDHADAEGIRASLGIEPAEDAQADASGESGADAGGADAASSAAVDNQHDDTAGAQKPEQKLDKRTREGKIKSLQTEIDTLTHAKHTTRREIDEAQAELTRLRAERETLKAPPAEVKPVATFDGSDAKDPQPNENDPKYQADNGWRLLIRDQAQWEARNEFRRQQFQAATAARQHQHAAAVSKTQETFDSKIKSDLKAANEAPDVFLGRAQKFLTSIHPGSLHLQQNEPYTGAVAISDVILHADHPRALIDHFVEHPDDYQRLSTLHSSLALVEMGKLVQRLDAAPHGPASTAPSKSKMPPPTKPLGGASQLSDERDDGDEASEESVLRHFARENEREGRPALVARRR